MMKVETVVCPLCARCWPVISEQGIYVELYDKCHHCVTRAVIDIRDSRLESVDYIIIICYDCAGQNTLCKTCEGTGWLASEPL